MEEVGVRTLEPPPPRATCRLTEDGKIICTAAGWTEAMWRGGGRDWRNLHRRSIFRAGRWNQTVAPFGWRRRRARNHHGTPRQLPPPPRCAHKRIKTTSTPQRLAARKSAACDSLHVVVALGGRRRDSHATAHSAAAVIGRNNPE